MADRQSTPCRAQLCVSTTPEKRMSFISFVKDAGEKLFHIGAAKSATEQAAAAPNDPAKAKAANDAAADSILNYIKSQGLSATGLTVTYDTPTLTASVFGVAPDQA